MTAAPTYPSEPRPPGAGPDEGSLQPFNLVDADHLALVAFAHAHARGSDERERAVAL